MSGGWLTRWNGMDDSPEKPLKALAEFLLQRSAEHEGEKKKEDGGEVAQA